MSTERSFDYIPSDDSGEQPDVAFDGVSSVQTTPKAIDILDEVAPSMDLVRTYLNQIGKTELLTAENEVELAKTIEVGVYAKHKMEIAKENGEKIPLQLERDLGQIAIDGDAASQQMLEANLRLVVSLAKRYTGRGMPLLDLVQEGNLGLIRAMEKFDYAKGFKFSTYATWWIRQAITRGMADQSRTIRLPVHLVEQVNKLARVKRELHQQLGRVASNDELASESGIPAEKIEKLLDHNREPISLDMPVGTDSEGSFGDFVSDSDADSPEDAALETLNQEELQVAINAALDSLTDREQVVIRLRLGFYGENYTLDKIGKEYGLSRERVRQIENNAWKKLKTGQTRALFSRVDTNQRTPLPRGTRL